MVDKLVLESIKAEYKRQSEWMELIASENYQSAAVLAAQSSVFANKYSEGFPGKRYYGGQENTDVIESLAIERAKQLFRSDHANVQALSGAAANVCAYAAMMEPGDTILWMALDHGGHLTHGAPVTFLSKVFNFVTYRTLPDGQIDYEALRQLALEHKPKVILAGFSAYPRQLDFAKFVAIANEVDAYAYADMAHIWGLIAWGVLPNPLDFGFHAMMTTTHKSLRWPRWALILTKWNVLNPLQKPENIKENLPTLVDRAVFPWVQWGPHMNTIAAIAVALGEAQQESFKQYATQILKNATIMSDEFLSRGYKLVTWGTDNHMVILDFSSTSVENGSQAEKTLDKIWISTSKSTIPNDPNPPFRPSGLRIGIQAMTTRGIKEEETKKIVEFIDEALKNNHDEKFLEELRERVREFCLKYPLPS